MMNKVRQETQGVEGGNRALDGGNANIRGGIVGWCHFMAGLTGHVWT
jgi:hypothetical protein